ncbi:MAG: DUF6311 domain-containing protein [Candidatus Magasanikbacteria bacterium]|nr:DUF6311 domain-containing protein [Candidatus Magasanikbacteria bacterium]
MSGGLKKAVNFLKSWDFWGPAVAGLIGGLVFFIFFGETFWPQNIDWILADGSDTSQLQLGWEFFRNSAWVWPWGIIKNLNYPAGISVLYTDSLPLLAIFFKLWRNILPANFQYIGLWMFISFILQGVYGFLLMRLIKKDTLLNILGSLFFIFSPIVWQRIAGHAPLVSHFVVLATLYICLSRKPILRAYHWGFILITALFTHPYLFFMIAPWWLVEQIRLYKLTSKIKWWVSNLIILSLLGALSFIIGMWTQGEGGAGGFGEFSMNLNSLFNSMGWSKIMPEWPIAQFQFEGFNYLGLGVLLLGVFSCYFFVFKKRQFFLSVLKRFWPFLLVSVFLTILALSNKVYFNAHLIFSYPLPKFIENIFSITRSSGRMFWPVYYLLVFAALFPLCFLKRSVAIIVICLALIFQLADLSRGLFRQNLNYTDKVEQFQSQTSFWREYISWGYVFSNYKHVVILPYFNRFDLPISFLVARNSKTLNVGYFVRKQAGTESFISEQTLKICSGNFDKDTAYLFFDNLYKCLPPVETAPNKYTLKKVFNFFVLSPQ